MPRKIYWKVLTKTRQSAWLGFAESKHTLTYEKKQRVEAYKGSLGCFVFEDKEVAEIWKAVLSSRYPDWWLVVPCYGHGRGKRSKVMLSSYPHIIDKFINASLDKMPLHLIDTPPVGTICFPAITCIE